MAKYRVTKTTVSAVIVDAADAEEAKTKAVEMKAMSSDEQTKVVLVADRPAGAPAVATAPRA